MRKRIDVRNMKCTALLAGCIFLAAGAAFLTCAAVRAEDGSSIVDGSDGSRQESDPAQADHTLRLCGPDEVIGIATDTYRSSAEAWEELYRYYDSSGEFLGEAINNYDYFLAAFHVIPKNRLMTDKDEKDYIIRRTQDLKEIARVPGEDWRYDLYGKGQSAVCIIAKDNTYLTIHRIDGTSQVIPLDGDGWIIPDEMPEDIPEDKPFSFTMYEPEGCLYLHVDGGTKGYKDFMVYEDGSVLTPDDESFPKALVGKVSGYLGNYLAIRDEEDGYSIVSLTGDILMTGVRLHSANDQRYYGACKVFTNDERIDFVLIREGETDRVFDETLTELGRIREKDRDENGRIQVAGGTVIGLPCEDLGWQLSTCVLTYLDKRVPAAKVQGGYVTADECGGFLPEFGEGDEIISFSKKFIYVRRAEGVWQVLRRSDLKVLDENPQVVSLQDETFAANHLEPDKRNPGRSKWVGRIFNEAGETIYTAENDRIYPAPDGNYFISRGVYAGIADPYGNWLMKTYRLTE